MATMKGIHHLSALTADAQKNLSFYTEVMGLRLVKKTVNQDDVGVYHLYYGDERGNPGTGLTFFEIPMAGRNHEGNNSISATSLRVSSDAALDYWKKRFEELDVPHEEIDHRTGRASLRFRDPEGQRLILVSDEKDTGVAGGTPWDKSPVPQEFGIVGLGPIHLTVPVADNTLLLMKDVMGFRENRRYPSDVTGQPDVIVLETGEGGSGAEIHIEERNDLPAERLGRGGVHHVAFRVENKEELEKWIEIIKQVRIPNSGFVDRFYFRSLYYREPNGILFELATDDPGFDTDEEFEHLGETLALPPFLEGRRTEIEARLKPLNTKPE